MEIVVYLTGFLLFCLLLLALPVELSLYLEKKERPADYRATLYWLFGLIAIDMTGKKEKQGKRLLPTKPKKTKKAKPRLTSLFGSDKSLRQIIRLLGRLRHSLHIKELKLHGRIGLGDPACTGMLFGMMSPFLLPGHDISLTADYREAVFEGYCKVRVRLSPIRVIGAFLAFVFSKKR